MRRLFSHTEGTMFPAMALRIEVVSDIICPWCFIGASNLEAALAARPDVDTEVSFRPFLLDPTTPPGGADLRERLRAKYNVDPEAMFGRVEAAARSAGIPLDFSKVQRTPNTLRGHVLIGSVAGPAQRRVAKALFAAYFLEGRDISDVEVLADIGAAHELDAAQVRALVTDEARLEATRQEALSQSERGIRGVPFFVFAEKYGVSGAQPPETLARALDMARAGAGDEASPNTSE